MRKNKLFLLILPAIFGLFFATFADKAEAAYVCSLNGNSYADNATCTSNCVQTANCTSLTGTGCGSCPYGVSGPTTILWCESYFCNLNSHQGRFYMDSCSTWMPWSTSNYWITGNDTFLDSCPADLSMTITRGAMCKYVNLLPPNPSWNMKWEIGGVSCPLSGGSTCNASNQCTKSGTCTLSTPPPTCSVSFSPNSITAPGSSTATVKMSNVTSATYGCTGPIPAPSGTALAVAASATYPFNFTAGQTGTETCTISVSGPGGSSTCSGSVTVNAPSCTPNCSCAANTCTGQTCSNGCSGLCNGTKNCCAGNGCATNTCTGQTCWDGCQWKSGTKTCSCTPTNPGCATNTCTGQTCWDGCQWKSGTKSCCAGNGCAANTCAGDQCWDGCQWQAGTKTCSCVNQCSCALGGNACSYCSGNNLISCATNISNGCMEITGQIDCSLLGSNYSCSGGSCFCQKTGCNTADCSAKCQDELCRDDCQNLTCNGARQCLKWMEVAP